MKLYIFALLVFLFTSIDLLDGVVARAHGKVTAFGGFWDSTMDRVSDFLIITAFAFGRVVRWEIVAPLLLFSFLISYVRSRGELASNNRITFAIGLIERTERLIVLFFSLLFYMLFPFVSIFSFNFAELICLFLLVLSFVTFLQRMFYAYKNL